MGGGAVRVNTPSCVVYPWNHYSTRFTLFTAEGVKKEGDEIMVDVGGPMCFQVENNKYKVLMIIM